MSTAAAARGGIFTYDDFCALVREDQKADLIDGVIYMASPENIDAHDLFGWLYSVMRFFVRRRTLGRVFGSRVACRLDEKNAPEPDILFVARRNANRLERGGVKGPPDLAVEIVSPESVERDYTTKRIQYERFGVREYWIIDEALKKVTLLRLNRHRTYREVIPREGVLHSQVLMGFWLDPNWLWQDPKPDALTILQQLLGER
jgi:Uma2 family endonuclease